jgi:hypothetical protein
VSPEERCDYCGKTGMQVGHLVESPTTTNEQNGRPAGDRTFICGGCVQICLNNSSAK